MCHTKDSRILMTASPRRVLLCYFVLWFALHWCSPILGSQPSQNRIHEPRQSMSSTASFAEPTSLPTISTGSLYPPRQHISESAPTQGNKLQNFKTRSLSAISILTLLTVFIKLAGTQGLVQLAVFLQAGMYNEATNVLQTGRFTGVGRWWILLTHLVAFDGPLLFPDARTLTPLIALACALFGVMVLVVGVSDQSPESNAAAFESALSDFGSSNMSGLLLVGASSFWIRTIQTYGMRWLFYPAALVVINDTMAYVCGVLFGKHPLLPAISPKKTWEGFLGAFACTLAFTIPLFHLLVARDGSATVVTTKPRDLWILGAYISIVAPFGGFLASVVKRAHGVKDFGRLIPGHGGLVDRLDCQVMTAPFVYLYLQTLHDMGQSP